MSPSTELTAQKPQGSVFQRARRLLRFLDRTQQADYIGGGAPCASWGMLIFAWYELAHRRYDARNSQMPDTPAAPSSSNLVIPYRLAAAGGAVVSLVLAIALVIVVRTSGTDVLATIALALATLAFVVQLIVFIVQTSAANQQMLQAQQLYGQMNAVLGQIGERTEGTQVEMRRISEHFLQSVFPKTVAAHSGPDASEANEAEELETAIETEWPTGSPPSVNRALLTALSAYPSEADAPPIIQRLAALSDAARRDFYRLVNDDVYYRSGDSSRWIGPGLPARGLEPSLGDLVEQFNVHDKQFIALSEVGRQVARLLVPEDDPPPYIGDGVQGFREEYRNFRKDFFERTSRRTRADRTRRTARRPRRSKQRVSG